MIDELEVNNILVQTTQSLKNIYIWEVAPNTLYFHSNVPNIIFLVMNSKVCGIFRNDFLVG